jgi:aryl-alcohol dehydrogenase-like predicted oxidoreductase
MKTSFTRRLGRSNIEVSALGMGCWAIGGPFWSGETPLGWGVVDDAESGRAIHTALEMGVTFFDTAAVYGAGHSEAVLGRALAGRREQVVIATKFGPLFDEDSRQVTGSDVSPAAIRKACEGSLRRLGSDWIDLYQLHINEYPVDEAGPVRETLEQLQAEGKIRAYGWSTDYPDRAEFFARGEHCSAIQVELNVLDDNPALVALCEKHDLGLINRGPLAMGLLTGKYNLHSGVSADDVRGQKSPEWMKYFANGQPSAAYMQKVDAVREILASNGRTVAQGALAWLWARSPKTIPIPGFRTVKQVEENVSALEQGPLTEEQFLEIEKILGRA